MTDPNALPPAVPAPTPVPTPAAPPTSTPRTRRPATPDRDRRTVMRVIRYTPAEFHKIAERARLCGKPIARYVRDSSLGVTPRVRRDHATADLIRHLARLGNNLNQLALVANERQQLSDTAPLRAVLDEVLAAIKRID